MHNVDPESFLAKNRAGAVMSYWTRIYKKTLEHVLFLPEAASSFAEILYKYILESKATTSNSSRCLLHSVPNWMRSPGAQCHGYKLSVLSFSLHRVERTFLWLVWTVSGLDAPWRLQPVLQGLEPARPAACFQRIQDTDLDLPYLIRSPTFSSLLCLSPPLLLLLIWKLKEYRQHLGTGKMLTHQTNFTSDLCNSLPHSTWTFDSWRCAKGENVKLQSSCPEEGVIQTYKEWQSFLPLL